MVGGHQCEARTSERTQAPFLAVLYGAGNGIIAIAWGTLSLALFGLKGFGKRVGLISLPECAVVWLLIEPYQCKWLGFWIKNMAPVCR